MPMMLSIMDEALRIIDNLCEDVTQESLKQIHENGSCTCTGCIMELFGVYIKFLRGGIGNLSTFWLSYMDMTDILLGLMRASREGDWLLHMASVRAMIPWCVAYDRLNYVRFLPCYHMSQLPTPHPDVHAEFMPNSSPLLFCWKTTG